MAKSRNWSSFSRRRMVQGLGAAGAVFLSPGATRGADLGARIAGKDVEIQLTSVSPRTFRLTVQPIQDGKLVDIVDDGTLLGTAFGAPAAKFRAKLFLCALLAPALLTLLSAAAMQSRSCGTWTTIAFSTSWLTRLICRRTSFSEYSRISTPSISTLPEVGS